MPFTVEEKRAAVDAVPSWFHSIDLGDGIVTPGRRNMDGMLARIRAMHIPELNGKSVLDIGTWDGAFAFEAERRGALRVVAMDKYVWEMDTIGPRPAVVRMRHAGTTDRTRIPDAWQRATLPGNVGFDTARRLLESNVEQIIDDLMTVDLLKLGSFDVVFYLGGLYHMANPLDAMRRMALLTRELAIIETAAVEIPAMPQARLFEFYPGAELNADPSNWFAPTPATLIGMCKAAGFRDAKIVARSGRAESKATPGLYQLRLTAHAWHSQ